MHEKLYVPNAQDSNAFPKVVIYFQRQSYGRLCFGRQLDRRRNRRLATNFASNCSQDDPIASFIVGEGRIRSRFLLLFCVWVAVTFYFHFVGQLPGGRPATASEMAWKSRKTTRYQEYLSALSAVTGCFMFFTYWLMEKFVDLANFLSAQAALSFFCCPLDFGILSLWLTGLCLILSLGYCNCICFLL